MSWIASAALPAAPMRISVGILPVVDDYGEPPGEVMASSLTVMLFREFERGPLVPVLLNPGGNFSPAAYERVLDLGRAAGVDAVLVTTLRPANRPEEGAWSLQAESYLLDTRTGRRSAPQTSTAAVGQRELRLLTYERPGARPSRSFESQPLGRATRRLAVALRETVVAQAAEFVGQGTTAAPAKGSESCEVEFYVWYGTKRAWSKEYELVINDRPATDKSREGAVSLSLTEGAVGVEVRLRDAPKGLPVQPIYLANETVDCRRAERRLILEIGAAGEAFLRWR
jgi:hypothetical protein